MSKTDGYIDAPHRKKKPQTSKASHRSNHKHQYERIIIESFVGWNWGKRCTICGRISSSGWPVLHNGDFLKPKYANARGVASYMFLNIKELKEKHKGVPIYIIGEKFGEYKIVEN